MPEAMPWATWGGIKASAAGPGALMTCVTIRRPVRMKMIVSWIESATVKVGANFEKVFSETMRMSIGVVSQGAGR